LLLESIPLSDSSGLDSANATLAVLRPDEAGPESAEALDHLVGVCWHTYPMLGGRGWQFRYQPNIIKQIEERKDDVSIEDGRRRVLAEAQEYFAGPTFKVAAWPESARQVSESSELQLALCEDEKTARAVCGFADDSDPQAPIPRRFQNAILAVTATPSALCAAIERARRLMAAEEIERQNKTGEGDPRAFSRRTEAAPDTGPRGGPTDDHQGGLGPQAGRRRGPSGQPHRSRARAELRTLRPPPVPRIRAARSRAVSSGGLSSGAVGARGRVAVGAVRQGRRRREVKIRDASFALRVVRRREGEAGILYRRTLDVKRQERFTRIAPISPLAFSAGAALLRAAVRATSGPHVRLTTGPFHPLDPDWGARVAGYARVVSGLRNADRLHQAAANLQHADPTEAAWWLGVMTRDTSRRALRALRILLEAVK
jgi:hypothetical protein